LRKEDADKEPSAATIPARQLHGGSVVFVGGVGAGGFEESA